jgi:ABC-type glycerol-3-phosphate transport system substrate-binding protein
MGTGSRRPLVRRAVLAALLVAGVLAVAPGTAEAATLELLVTTTADTLDPDDGLLSLREAIDQSNAHNGPSTITLQQGTTSSRCATATSRATTGERSRSARSTSTACLQVL